MGYVLYNISAPAYVRIVPVDNVIDLALITASQMGIIRGILH